MPRWPWSSPTWLRRSMASRLSWPFYKRGPRLVLSATHGFDIPLRGSRDSRHAGLSRDSIQAMQDSGAASPATPGFFPVWSCWALAAQSSRA